MARTRSQTSSAASQDEPNSAAGSRDPKGKRPVVLAKSKRSRRYDPDADEVDGDKSKKR
jgi:hypothetical protein